MLTTKFLIVANIVFVDPTYAYIALAIVAAGVILMWLMVKSSNEFTVEDTEANAEEFAGVDEGKPRTRNHVALRCLRSHDHLGSRLPGATRRGIRHLPLNNSFKTRASLRKRGKS